MSKIMRELVAEAEKARAEKKLSSPAHGGGVRPMIRQCEKCGTWMDGPDVKHSPCDDVKPEPATAEPIWTYGNWNG